MDSLRGSKAFGLNAKKTMNEQNESHPEQIGSLPISILSKTLDVETTARVQTIDVTDCIQEALTELNVQTGVISLQSLHTTTGLFLNEAQKALLVDLQEMLELLVPKEKRWKHNDPAFSDCDRLNAQAHLRAILLGQTLSLQVLDGYTLLGYWQRILLAELDGPRRRTIQFQFQGTCRKNGITP